MMETQYSDGSHVCDGGDDDGDDGGGGDGGYWGKLGALEER